MSACHGEEGKLRLGGGTTMVGGTEAGGRVIWGQKRGWEGWGCLGAAGPWRGKQIQGVILGETSWEWAELLG